MSAGGSGGAGGGARGRSAAAKAGGGGSRVAVLERRGKFFVAEPFFGPGPRHGGQPRPAGVGRGPDRRARGTLGATAGPAGGRGSFAGWAAPTWPRDVIEGLMVDRGLRRGFDPAVEHEAREASAFAGVEDGRADRAADARGTERRDLRALPTFTVDPASARDFDDAISAVDEPDGTRRVWVHIADVSAHVRLRLSARPRGLPARDERVRPGRRRADAAAGAVQPRLLAGSRTGSPGRNGRDGDRRRPGAPARLLPLGDPLRRAARLRPGRPAVRRPGDGRRRVGSRRWPARGRPPPRWLRGGPHGSARNRLLRARVRVRRPRRRGLDRAGRADRVAPDDRAPDDRRQRAGGASS